MSSLAGLTAFMAGCMNEIGTYSGAHAVEDAAPPEKDAGPPPVDAGPPVLCRVTGGGQIEAGDNPDVLGGNGQPFGSEAGMHWNHLTQDDGHLNGRVDTIIECRIVDGPPARPPVAPANSIRFSGTGTFNGETCDFEVYIEDHGEPGTSDFYQIDIDCPTGDDYSAANTLLNGNLQIHAVPPGHLP